VTGLLALHGGGEYVTGDEGSMDALVRAATEAAATDGPGTTPRIVIVPTAAARQRPDAAARTGEQSFAAAARRAGVTVEIGIAGIVARPDAMDPRLVEPLAAAHLIHLPGGDPDLIPAILRDSPAWAAMCRAYDCAAVLAGASAGAMALGPWTWTPHGGVPGLGRVPGVVVVPHVDARSWPDIARRWGAALPAGQHALGLGERTAVIIEPGRPWRVVGEGEVRWLPSGTPPDSPLVLVDGGEFTP
jgi:cyanophycinase-like exopeptidase